MKLSDKAKHGIIQLLLGIIMAAIVFLFADKIVEFQTYGYIGIFIITFLSACTVIIPAPGWVAVIAASSTLNPYLLGAAAGIGSGLGEIVGYNIGNGAVKVITKEKNNNFEIIKKYGAYGIFFLAFIPNPFFDIAGIVAGALKIPLSRFLLAVILGRTIRFMLLAYLGMQIIALF